MPERFVYKKFGKLQHALFVALFCLFMVKLSAVTSYLIAHKVPFYIGSIVYY